MGVPVSSISIAFLVVATERARATPGVVQNRPICTPGVAKAADSAATARSQVATNWHPAAVARPCTCAIYRLGQQPYGLHDLGAESEDGGVGLGVAVDHLVQVVAGAEHWPLGAQHHHSDSAVALKLPEQLLQFAQQFGGQGVAPPGVVESEDGHSVLQFVANELSDHTSLLDGWCFEFSKQAISSPLL